MLINTFSKHYKGKYGKAVGKIALGRNRTCPNRALGGCTYCAPESFRPYYLKDGDSLAQQIARGKGFLKTRKFKHYFAYFQQETTTAAPVPELLDDFRFCLTDPACIGLIISTRPDYLEDALLERLAVLADHGGRQREIIVELGLQSSHDRTLEMINRNHTYGDFQDAVSRLKVHAGLQLGVHLILGLPGETEEDMAATLGRLNRLPVDHLKLHHLQVIRNTPLSRLFSCQPFKTYGPQEYLEMLARLLALVDPRIIMHRLWSSSDPEILIAPQWDIYTHELTTLLHKILQEQGLFQGKFAEVGKV